MRDDPPTALVQPSVIEKRLASLADVREAREYEQGLAALQQIVKAQGGSLADQNTVACYRGMTIRRGGQFVKALARQRGTKGQGLRPTLGEVGLSNQDAYRWQLLADAYTDAGIKRLAAKATDDGVDLSINHLLVLAQRAAKEGARQERRETNREKVESTPEIAATARYATILIDPPWDFGEEGDQDVFGRARPTYDVMSDDAIEALPVGALADDDCHLYMWITARGILTGKAWRFAEAWGFRPVTTITWCKPSIGMGNYFRTNTEHLVFAVKGSQPLKRHNVGTWFEAPRGRGGHSSKPVESYELIESCSPGPYIELFARSQRADWTAWGADADA